VIAALHSKRRRRREIILDRNALEMAIERLAARRPAKPAELRSAAPSRKDRA